MTNCRIRGKSRGGNFNRQVTGGAILMCEVMP